MVKRKTSWGIQFNDSNCCIENLLSLSQWYWSELSFQFSTWKKKHIVLICWNADSLTDFFFLSFKTIGNFYDSYKPPSNVPEARVVVWWVHWFCEKVFSEEPWAESYCNTTPAGPYVAASDWEIVNLPEIHAASWMLVFLSLLFQALWGTEEPTLIP